MQLCFSFLIFSHIIRYVVEILLPLRDGLLLQIRASQELLVVRSKTVNFKSKIHVECNYNSLTFLMLDAIVRLEQ